MLVEDIEFTLKDGRKALLRCPKEEDIQGTLEYLRISSGETEFIMRSPEECDQYTYEGEKVFFENVNADPDRVMLLCVVDGRVAGNCGLIFNSKQKTRHRASVGIALISEFWGLGIGTQMFQEMIRLTEERGDVLQMELEFVEGNSRARGLYEKMGFRVAGIHPNAIRWKDGSLRNEYLMIREMA